MEAHLKEEGEKAAGLIRVTMAASLRKPLYGCYHNLMCITCRICSLIKE
ncbi:hypothetical protein GXN76_12555 [Kroppenstedtia pulmonis]|uniref:Uncharacterized protein n=1 Tax=Kroppenstedtia pulmonis TaxID=1380685 RepID=A0A7D3YAY2_9BACL|nr:hypothetical protein [Kroppenstedtia pulmonis]QKG85221.1 hypothetical protein GXN76_12555 [Kroppenstedtia pulmonis]